jgi:hypothetical protein
MTNINTIKNWFKTGLTPTQTQFWAFLDSIWFKTDAIPVENIEGLQETLNDKADGEALSNHLADLDAHAALFNNLKLTGQFLANRDGKMFFTDNPLEFDTIIGEVQGTFLNAATYTGGNPLLLSSYIKLRYDLKEFHFDKLNSGGFGPRITAYHNGLQQYPQAGDTCYQDDQKENYLWTNVYVDNDFYENIQFLMRNNYNLEIGVKGVVLRVY